MRFCLDLLVVARDLDRHAVWRARMSVRKLAPVGREMGDDDEGHAGIGGNGLEKISPGRAGRPPRRQCRQSGKARQFSSQKSR